VPKPQNSLIYEDEIRVAMAGTELRPLLNDVSDVRIASGRYNVQLEIPKTSTLSKMDVERILEASSWKREPSQIAESYEGARSILLRREHPIKKGKVELPGLQISGIGYRKADFSGPLPIPQEEFHPPSTENFINQVPGTLMSTSYAKGAEMMAHRPSYRALGTYTSSELTEKIMNTRDVSNINLEKMIVPHVEAYGRYLDPTLQNEDGPFGFVVFPSPDPKKPRMMNEFLQQFWKGTEGKTGPETVMAFYYGLSRYITVLVDSLRELHDKGRRVHLQPHLENAYLLEGIPYVVDWATMRRLDGNADENIINRTIDLKKPTDDYMTLFTKIFSNAPEHVKAGMSISILELVMEVYSGHMKDEIDLLSLSARQERVLKKNVSDFESMALWMKDEGIEGFKKRLPAQLLVNISRNDPCPCGSGLKFKKCHGGIHQDEP
jgi:hypothetical protein